MGNWLKRSRGEELLRITFYLENVILENVIISSYQILFFTFFPLNFQYSFSVYHSNLTLPYFFFPLSTIL